MNNTFEQIAPTQTLAHKKIVREGDTNVHLLESETPLSCKTTITGIHQIMDFVKTDSDTVLTHNDHGAHILPAGTDFVTSHQQVTNPASGLARQVID